MTTYNTISDASVSPESCITDQLFQRLTNNPIAITEGSTGAPKVLAPALQTGGTAAVTTATIRDLAVTNSKIATATITVGKLSSAVQAKLVPGGNNHDHTGVSEGHLSNDSFQNNALRGGNAFYNVMLASGSVQVNGRFTLPPSTTFIPARGFYNFVSEELTANNLQVVVATIGAYPNGLYWMDGINMTLINPDGALTQSVYYQTWTF